MIFLIYTIISTCTQLFASQCIMIGFYGIANGLQCIAMGSLHPILFLVEEANVEDADGKITKELYELRVAPLESHVGYSVTITGNAFKCNGILIISKA